MRFIGLVLVLIGAVVLGYQGLVPKPQSQPDDEPWWHFTPLIGGIALVSGLLFLASSGRREET